MISIRTKLTVLVYGAVLVTALTLSSIGISHLSRITRQHSQDSLQLMCDAEKEHLNITTGNLKQAVDIMKDLILNDLTDIDRFTTDSVYRKQLTRGFERQFFQIASHTNGAVSYYMYYAPELLPEQPEGFVWVKRNRFSSFSALELPRLSDFSREDFDHVGWYYTPVENGKPTWLKPYANKNLGIYMISYAIPIYLQGTLIGVVGMDINFSLIIEEINRLIVYQNGYAYLTDEHNTVIYHKALEANVPLQASTEMLEMGLALDNGWKVYVAAPKKEINRERAHLTQVYVLTVLIISLICMFICSHQTNRLITPLLELTAATKKIASGDLNVHITVQSKDEIGQLAETFQKTVQQLPEYMYRDSLTGVRNTSAYRRAVSRLEEHMANGADAFGICVFDVNNLKQTNDLYGHETGNKLLINATRLICRIFSHSPVFRIGGDEFVVILEKTDFTNRASLLQQFELECQSTTFTASGITFPVSVAYGLATYDCLTDKTYEDIFTRADACMYNRKKEIKARFFTAAVALTGHAGVEKGTI